MGDAVAAPAPHRPAAAPDRFARYLDDCRRLVLAEIEELVPRDHVHSGGLYSLMLDYPLREGKGLRPALCIATCRALGGSVAAVIRSAAVLELYHNAFLIHDDVEDGSEMRRRKETLHRLHGTAIAVNVGDGMLAMTLRPLLDNMRLVGLGKALRILETVAEMSRESAEGQMMELEWVRNPESNPTPGSYARMAHKKSSWYTFLTPMTVGAIAAGADQQISGRLRRLATLLGFAFQVQDDVLNLAGEESAYGKEIDGDLWEGKLTLILVHALRAASPRDRRRALSILAKRRSERPTPGAQRLRRQIERLHGGGEISDRGRRSLLRSVRSGAPAERFKTEADVRFLRGLIEAHGSIDFAWDAARKRSHRAARTFAELGRRIEPSPHRDFLAEVVGYVVKRRR